MTDKETIKQASKTNKNDTANNNYIWEVKMKTKT